MKTITILFLILLIAFSSYAQEIVATSGQSATTSGYTVDWTIGETVIETLSSGSSILTQGFHQSKLAVTAVSDLLYPNFELNVFPNPTQDFIQIRFNELPNHSEFSLFDLTGKLLQNENISSEETQLDLNAYPNGIYVLKIYSGNLNVVQEFKIIKQ